MNQDDISARARQFQRHATQYEARIEPMPEHAEQFRLSFPDAQAGMAVIDVSEGGLGLQSGIYLPKNMRLTLHISSVEPEATGQDAMSGAGHGIGAPPRGSEPPSAIRESQSPDPGDLILRGIVRRCTMVDHKPNYQIGIQFLDPSGHDERRLVDSGTRSEPATTNAEASSVTVPVVPSTTAHRPSSVRQTASHSEDPIVNRQSTTAHRPSSVRQTASHSEDPIVNRQSTTAHRPSSVRQTASHSEDPIVNRQSTVARRSNGKPRRRSNRQSPIPNPQSSIPNPQSTTVYRPPSVVGGARVSEC